MGEAKDKPGGQPDDDHNYAVVRMSFMLSLLVGILVMEPEVGEDPIHWIRVVLSMATISWVSYIRPSAIPLNPLSLMLALTAPLEMVMVHIASSFRPPKPGRSIRSRSGETKQVALEEHSGWGLLTDISVNWLGANMYLDYLGPIQFNTPVLDEYAAINDHNKAMKVLKETVNLRVMMVVLVAIVIVSTSKGETTAIVAGMAIMAVAFMGTRGKHHKTKIDLGKVTLSLPNGVYRILTSMMGFNITRGIGYVQDGVLYTRLHVTAGNPIVDMANRTHYPCYMNRDADNVAYGGIPNYAKLAHGEEILVCLAGPHSSSILKYRTVVTVAEDGTTSFRGSKSIPGSSGSPFFREIITTGADEGPTTTYQFAGCIGWYHDRDPNGTSDKIVGTELGKNEHMGSGEETMPIEEGTLRQIFKHPGSGKTRNLMPHLMLSGLRKYGRVYITGPTRTVCRELHSAMEEFIEKTNARGEVRVSLMTSDASAWERGGIRSKNVLIASHATMLALLIKGDINIKQPGAWIMDEAHYLDSMSLKDFLRERVAKGRKDTLIEMTATGYDVKARKHVFMSASNYPIEDVTMNKDEMLAKLPDEEGKVVIFATGISGARNTTVESLVKRLKKTGKEVVTLHRANFETGYQQAKEMEEGYIVTTDISEMGANYGVVHSVYDFQESPKPVVVSSYDVALVPTIIDRGQMVQRRGRTGRLAAGRYVSPQHPLLDSDYQRAEFMDRQIFADTMKMTIQDPMPPPREIPSLNTRQLAFWKCMGEGGVNSARTVLLVADAEGSRDNNLNVARKIQEWRKTDKVEIKTQEDVVYKLGFWDDRDRQVLTNFLGIKESDSPGVLTQMLKAIRNVRIPKESLAVPMTSYRTLTSVEDVAEEVTV